MKNLAPKEAFKRVPKLQSQLNALLNCKMHQHHIGRNGLLISAYTLLLKDSLILYPMLNVGVIGLIDQVFKMKKTGAKKVLGVYTLFVKETEALIKLYDICRTFTNRLPPIHPAKATLIDVLNSHISKLEDDDGQEVDETEDGHVAAEMEDALLAASHNTAASAHHHQKHDDDSDSDTSSDSSDDEGKGGNGNNNSFDWGFGNAFGSQPQQQQPGQGYPNGAAVATGQLDPRASMGPNSFAFLTSQPSQPATTSAQGWDIFDTSSFGQPQSQPQSFNNGQQGGYQDPFAFVGSPAPSHHQTNPAAAAPGSPSSINPNANYQDRAAATKSGLMQFYTSPPQSPPQQQHHQQQQPQDNPFGATSNTANPFGAAPQQNPFGNAATASPVQSPPPSYYSPPPAATTTSPAPSSSSYNPFL